MNSAIAQKALPPGRSSSQRSYARYCLVLALVPVIAMLSSILIARSDWYLRHQRNSYLAISDYAFTLKGENCAVVIYGDSSALTGVSPAIIEKQTGLSTCNIAQPNTALAMAGTFALDTYLEHNSRPKFIVFQFTAPDFAPTDPNGRLNEEGSLQLTRHKLDAQSLRLFARHPIESLEFSEFILSSALLNRDPDEVTYHRAWTQIASTHGRFSVSAPPLKTCAGPLERRAPDPRWILQLRNQYAQGGTRVLIFVAPYPECDASYDYYSQRLPQLADNPVTKFSIDLFNEQNHFTPAGADLNSQTVAEKIASAARN